MRSNYSRSACVISPSPPAIAHNIRIISRLLTASDLYWKYYRLKNKIFKTLLSFQSRKLILRHPAYIDIDKLWRLRVTADPVIVI